MNNFTVADIVQVTVAIFVFAIFVLPPGYVLGASSNLLNFRRQPPVEKFLLGGDARSSNACPPMKTPIPVPVPKKHNKVRIRTFLSLSIVNLGIYRPLCCKRYPGFWTCGYGIPATAHKRKFTPVWQRYDRSRPKALLPGNAFCYTPAPETARR